MDRSEDRHALIVEDELIVGMGVRHMLEDLGYTTFAFASTGRQAAEQCRLRRPDLATVDLQLLEGDGMQAAQGILDACGAVPLIFVTGSPELVNVPWATVVEKPVTPGALARAVAIACDRTK